jgi:hypothetical protein
MDASLEVNQQEPETADPESDLLRFYPLRRRKLKHWLALPAGILLLLFAFTALLYGFFTTWSAVERHGRVMVFETFPLFLLIAGIAFIIGLILLVVTGRRWNDGVGVYPTGIKIIKSKTSNFLHCNAIQRFDTRIKLIKFATSVMDVRPKIILETGQGKGFTITDRIENMNGFVQQCREKILPRLYEKSLRTLRQGGQLTFHQHLKATLNALLIENQPYPWERLEPVIKNRSLAIQESSSQRILFKAPINQFRNTDILLAFLENPPRNEAYLSPR